MITLVSFMRPVNIRSVGVEDWTQSRDGKDITCMDKGNHLLFTTRVGTNKTRRVKVPLTNIAQVTEDELDAVEEPAPKGKKAEPKETP